MEKYVLCQKDSLAVGEKRTFQIDKTGVVLVRTEDGFYAIRNVCPHQGGPLGAGALQGAAMPSDAGSYCYERRGQIVYCPWHHWEFDAKTGCSVRDPQKVKVKSYQVAVEGEAVVLYK